MTDEELLQATVAELRRQAQEARAQGETGLVEDGAADWLEQNAHEATAQRFLRRMPTFTQHEAKKGYYRTNTGGLPW